MTDSLSKRPPIAITMGDPAGVGPEIIAKYFNERLAGNTANCLVVGRANAMIRALELIGSGLSVETFENVESVEFSEDSIAVLECGDPAADSVEPGEIGAAGGRAAFDALKLATDLALANQVDAIVTAPLNKKALNAAGHHVPGHTELLAQFCGVDRVAMMLHLPKGDAATGDIGLSVVHVSLHTALKNVFDDVTTQSIIEKSELANRFCLSLLQAKGLDRLPRIAVAALNPHGGEQGLFGREEIEVIAPAVETCRSRGMDIVGPEPCDTVIRRASMGEFDAVIAMYHDQGHIALKMLDMFSTVNVTLGLPVIRTSVAHGTADDIAWSGRASCHSLSQAIQVARELVIAKRCRETTAAKTQT